MTFDEVKQCITQLKVVNVKITDINGKKIIEFIGELSPDNLIRSLESFLPTLQSYGRVNMIAANESQYKQNWKESYTWPVIFSGVTTQLNSHEQPKQSIGFVSHNEATLMAQLASIQQQMAFNAKIMELEKKIEGATKEDKWERLADKYFPIVGPMLGFKFEGDQMDQMMKMYQLQMMMSGKVPMMQQGQGMAGLSLKNNPTVQQTDDEKKEAELIVAEMDALSEKTSCANILALLKGLNANPAYIDMALNFMNQPKTQNNG